MANEIKDLRLGNITSSEVFNIMADGRKAGEVSERFWTYISECNLERRLGVRLENETSSREMSWGLIVEYYVQQTKLGAEYKIMGKEVKQNPDIPYHTGSPDAQKFDEGGTVMEQKSPFTRKSFCTLVDPLYYGLTGMEAMNAIRDGFTDKDGMKHAKHKSGEQYYWQIISNAVLTNSKYAELLVYCPYEDEVNAVKACYDQIEGVDVSQFKWLEWAYNEELPYIKKGGVYQDINIIRWEIQQSEKDMLLERIEQAGKYLIKL